MRDDARPEKVRETRVMTFDRVHKSEVREFADKMVRAREAEVRPLIERGPQSVDRQSQQAKQDGSCRIGEECAAPTSMGAESTKGFNEQTKDLIGNTINARSASVLKSVPGTKDKTAQSGGETRIGDDSMPGSAAIRQETPEVNGLPSLTRDVIGKSINITSAKAAALLGRSADGRRLASDGESSTRIGEAGDGSEGVGKLPTSLGSEVRNTFRPNEKPKDDLDSAKADKAIKARAETTKVVHTWAVPKGATKEGDSCSGKQCGSSSAGTTRTDRLP